MKSGADETLAIPARVRAAVDTRDGMHCRVCGRFLGERRALHHIEYGGDERGMGGRRSHVAEEIVTVCWMPGDGDCHRIVHSDKGRWQPLLRAVVHLSGVTALQLQRWARSPRPGAAQRWAHPNQTGVERADGFPLEGGWQMAAFPEAAE